MDAFSGAPGDFKRDVGFPADFVDTAMGKSAIAPDQGQARIPLLGLGNDQRAAIPLLDGGRLDLNGDGEAKCVYDEEPFPPFDLLARVKTAEPPFSVVLTDWLSTAPALARGSRWALSLQRL